MRQLSAILLLFAALGFGPGLPGSTWLAGSAWAACGGQRCEQARQTVVLCTIDAPPVTTVAHDGVLDDILREAVRRAGGKLRMVIAPSERGLVNANNGAVDGVSNRIAGLEKAYPNLVRVAEPNLAYEFTAFAKRPLAVKDWSDLAPLRVGLITGWKILEENVRAAQIIRADEPGQLFELLAADRVDVVLYERRLGLHHVAAHGIKGVHALEPALARRDMHVYLNARHAALAPRLAAALREMKADGSYSAIIARKRGR